MNKKNLNLAGIVILASILSSCDLTGAGSGSDSNVRQSSLTISETPLFYYKATTSNQYYLALSNNTDQELSLVGSSITNSSLAESIDFRSMVDTSECNKLAAKSDCRLRIKLPYANNEGYYTFRMNYQTDDGTDIYVDKVVSFSSSLPESGGLVSSQKFIDSVVINSDRFTLALPIVLDRDYSAIKLEVGNKNERSAYSKIICDTQGVYKRNSSCTALVELDGHIADPQLRLSTTDTNDHINSYNFVTGVVFNNQAHLVYLNAPVIVRSGSSGAAGNTVRVLNIGTLVASSLKTSLENSSNLSLTQTSNCSANLIHNGSCTITYTPTTPANPVLGVASQKVEYSGGALSTTKDKFPVYRNKAALQAPKVVSIEPANNDTIKELKPQIKVTFSEPVDSNTVDSTSFYLTDSSGRPVTGTISWIDNNIIAFTPTSDLLYGAQYTINLATDKIANSAGKVSTKATTSNFSIFSAIVVHATSTQNVMMGDTFKFRAISMIGNSGSSLVKAAFVNPAYGVITSNPASCNLNAATKSCTFSAIFWNTSIANGPTFYSKITVTATNSAVVVGNNPLNLTVTTPTVYLPATGQTATTPITPSEGMDGWYQAGIKIDDSTRFTTEGNCTTDNLTGLMWVKNWSTINTRVLNWYDALAIIKNANASGGWCGFRDWNLPTVNELSSLVNYGNYSSPAHWLNGQNFDNVAADWYWSSTSVPNTNDAWLVSFLYGGVVASNKGGTTNYVWAVRGGR